MKNVIKEFKYQLYEKRAGGINFKLNCGHYNVKVNTSDKINYEIILIDYQGFYIYFNGEDKSKGDEETIYDALKDNVISLFNEELEYVQFYKLEGYVLKI